MALWLAFTDCVCWYADVRADSENCPRKLAAGVDDDELRESVRDEERRKRCPCHCFGVQSVDECDCRKSCHCVYTRDHVRAVPFLDCRRLAWMPYV